MKKAILYALLSLTAVISAYAQSWVLPKDENGWTILTPSSDSRLIYVSNNGDDATAQTYSLSEEGSDPRDPSINVNAYSTIDAAKAQIRDGYPDWILLERGDSWVANSLRMDKVGNGRNTNERIVFTYYGTSGDRPVIKTDDQPIACFATDFGLPTSHDWAFIGIEYYAYKHDPNSPDYHPSLDHTPGTFILNGGSNLLIEDCNFNFVELVIQADEGKQWNNVEIRRNIITDTYWKSSCDNFSIRPSAAFISGVNNYLIEENMADHTGWSEDIATAGRNQYNHGWYIQSTNSGELIFRGNIVSRPSANASQHRSGGIVEKNLSIESPAGLFVAHDDTHGAGANYGTTTCRYNVVTDGLWMGPCSKSSGANWGITFNETIEQGTIIQENIVTHNLDPQGGLKGIDYDQSHANYISNIVYDFDPDQDMSDPSWSDPGRSVASYNASIGGPATSLAFIMSNRNRGVHEWPYELSAYAVINYIREGFNLSTLDPGPWKSGNVTGVSVPLASSSPVSIYPNPLESDNDLIIDLGNDEENFLVSIVDVNGQEVHSVERVKRQISIDGTQLSSGLYIIRLESDSKSLTNKLVVKKD